MALSKHNTYNRLNWEDSEFPILCQTCLGDNPYIRMTKDKFGQECKICERPFTIFRWCPGSGMRFKKTEVCQTCCKLKNICQTCLLDLEYGLPTQVRDEALKIKDELPRSVVNKEYYIQTKEKELADVNNPLGKMQNASEMLSKLARTAPYYQRNKPHICSFWVKGECKRGEECPYRHEKPTDPNNPLSDQNIRDRYYGNNDPVANKMLKRASELPTLEPPEDKTVTTLYIGNLGDKITEGELRNYFYQFGEIRSVSLVSKQQCAFVQFTTRYASEHAARQCYNKLVLAGRKLIVRWGRSQGQFIKKGTLDSKEINSLLPPVPGLPKALPIPPESFSNYFNIPKENITNFPILSSNQYTSNLIKPPPLPVLDNVNISNKVDGNLPPPPMFPNKKAKIHYPSQDPQREGTC